jgi:TonB-dependent starch-binding outer membrane protein SusC
MEMLVNRRILISLVMVVVGYGWSLSSEIEENKNMVAPMDEPDPNVDQNQAVATEKVIVVGYGAMKKKDITGSVSIVDAKDLKKSNATNVASALQGKASGVTITQNSGQPGKPMQVRIRGMGSINNSDPLYVVDGLPTLDIQYLNPQDIETITVLKDASSTSIYGARGSNGVVLITTKKGVNGTSKVSYNGTYGLSSPWKNPDMTTASEWTMLHNEALKNNGDSIFLPTPDAAHAKGTDWWSEVTRKNAVNFSHNFSLAQGDKSLNYFLSGGTSKDAGIIKGSESNKNTVRANVTAKPKSWLTIGNTIGFTNQKTHLANEVDEWNGTLIAAISMDPITPVRDSLGNLASSSGSGILNPVGIVERNSDFVESNRIKGNVFASVKPINSLELKTNYGIDIAQHDSSVFKPKYEISGADQRSSAEVRKENTTQNDWVWENTASYDLPMGEKHFVKILAGMTAEENNSENLLAVNSGLPTNDPSQRFLSSTLGLNPLVEGSAQSSALLSYLGRVNYDYDTKYFLTTAIRADGSSKFGPENRWGYFPSIGAGWDITKESFLSGSSFIDYLKLRAGWGVIGNQNIDNYLYTSTTRPNQNYVFGENSKEVIRGATFTSAGNPAIQWEEQRSTNVGIDFTTLGKSLEFTSDFYVKQTSKMLLRSSIPGQVGLQNPPMINGGDVENKGFDLGITYQKDFGAFTTKLSGNFSMYRNEVTKLGLDNKPISAVPFRDLGNINRSEVGKPIASFYGKITDGIFQNQAEIDRHFAIVNGDTVRVQNGVAPGDIRYRDADKDGVADVGFIGSPHPDFTYGLSLELGHKGAYGGVDFYMFLQGVQGNEIYNGTRFYTDQTSGFFNLDRRMLGRWTPTNPTNDVTLPRMNAGDANNTAISDRYVEDGSYMRIKTVALGYTIPASAANILHIPEIRVYAGVTNLLTLTGYKGFDPEVGSGRFSGSPQDDPDFVGGLDMGIDRANYPQARTVYTGMDISF